MEIYVPAGFGCVVALPPPDRRITPPPDMDVSPPLKTVDSSKDLRSSRPQHAESGTIPAVHHGPQAPMSPISPTVTRVARSRTDSPNLGADTTQRSSAAHSSILCPRPFEALYTERAYVTSLVQQQAAKAEKLIWQYADVEAQLKDVVDMPKKRRQLRKHLSLLTSRSNEAGEQYRALFMRLGELDLEIQSREAWGRVHQQKLERLKRLSEDQSQRHLSDGDAHSPGTSSPCPTTSPSPATSWGVETPVTPLNAASPIFVPGQARAFSCLQKDLELPANCPGPGAPTHLETVEETAEECTCNQELEYEYCEAEGVKPTKLVHERRNSWDGSIMSPMERRLSLPNLHCLWSE